MEANSQPGWALWVARIVTQAICTVILQQIIVASGVLNPFTTWVGGWVGNHVALTGWVLAFFVGLPITALALTAAGRVLGQPRSTSAIGARASGTRLVIEYRMITPGTPIRHPIHMLHMIKVAPEQGGGGLGVTMGGAGETKAWPSMQYECDVINYGPAAIVNVEMSVGLVWQEAIRTEKSIKPGGVELERMWPFTIARIDPGPENKFTFYILNTPDHVVSVGFWREARGQRVDRAAPEPIPVTVTTGLPIAVFPLLEAEIEKAPDDKPGVIPIAISEVRQRGFMNYPITGRPAEPGAPQDSCLLMFGEVRIVNISRVDPVNLDMRLRLTTSDGGWNVPLIPGQTDWLSRRLDQTVGAKYQRKRGEPEPRYLENPIHLGPGEATSGQLVFFLPAVDDERRAQFLQVEIRNGFKKRLEVADLVSGADVTFDVPGTYRGSERNG